MKYAVLMLLTLNCWFANAKVEALFHPHGPTLEKIGEWIQQAEHNVDIAMYSMDVSDSSPVVQALKSPAVVQKMKSGELKIRLIYEGYDTKERNSERMGRLEALGIDVRYLGKGPKMHHKFAVIDLKRVVSGSANWSMYSVRNYNENILFFENEQEAADRYQNEFTLLWTKSKEYGRQEEYQNQKTTPVDDRDFSAHFNSSRILKDSYEAKIYLTDQLVRLIDEAKSEIDIATTRIRLQPILEAVHRAASRGVHVKILLSQDDYHDIDNRARWLFDVAGIELRIKFYNLRPSNYMHYQMHNKFLIVDRKMLATGSFNWSNSSENRHIENSLELRGSIADQVLQDFEREFGTLWDMGRADLTALETSLEVAKQSGIVPKCGFKPVAMTIPEIRELLAIAPKCSG